MTKRNKTFWKFLKKGVKLNNLIEQFTVGHLSYALG